MKYILYCIIFLCLSCSSNSNKEDETQLLMHKEIKLSGMMLGSPGGIQKLDDELIIMDYKSDSVFHRISLSEKKYLGQFGVKGQGPDEFIHLTSIQPYSDKALCGYDIMKKEVKIIKKDSSRNEYKSYSLKKISDSWIFDVIPFKEKTFIANGCFKDSMFSILNDKENYVCLSGEFPYKDDNEKKISSRHRALAYQGILRITPKGKLAFATMSAKILFLYNIHHSQLIKNRIVTDSYAEYKLDDTEGGSSYSVAQNGNLPFCYRDLSITESNIYALYSGRSFKEYKLAYSVCQYIYIYDWNGNQKSLLKLDIPIYCFCVDEKANRIYGVANNPDPVLVSFDLPS